MDRTADLDSALSFVIGRIAEQAKVAGGPSFGAARILAGGRLSIRHDASA
jgi:hypothetical protein